MIGWRVGWTVAPDSLMPDLVAVSLANVVVPVGIAQDAAAVALRISDFPCHVRPILNSDIRNFSFSFEIGLIAPH